MTQLRQRLGRFARAVGRRAGLIVLGVACLVGGYLLRVALAPAPVARTGAAGAADKGDNASGEAPTTWTCSMHPEVRKPAPGLCPKCAMKLIPVRRQAGAAPVSLREFRTSEAAAALMRLEVTPAERKFVTAEIRMVGKIAYDETKLAYITAWVPGRLDRLHIDYTGVQVRKGDHMADIYSPQLLSAQEELLQAVKAVKGLKQTDSPLVRQMADATLTAAREKLRLLGLKPEQIAQVVVQGRPTDHLTLYAPIGGVVVHKDVQQGTYVKTGTRIYTIADLSQVWVRLDAYESDLDWLSPGQEVEFTTTAHPGERLVGQISFIDPILDERTPRTVKVRVTQDNPGGRLKPGMFVKAVVRATVPAGGKVVSTRLAGKWICPHHPDVIEDSAGKCRKCDWPLAKAESIYNIVDPAKAQKPLVVPASAVLQTGTRAVVYVQVDPSLLQVESVTDFSKLLLDVRARLDASDADRGVFLNTTCPIMGTKLDLRSVPENLTRSYGGGKVGFCCAGCPERWDKLSDAEKQAKLDLSAEADRPLTSLWRRLSPGLRKQLLAASPARQPPVPLRHKFVGEINQLLKRPDFHEPAAWKSVTLTSEARKLLELGPANLPALKLTRLNRLLLEAALPEGLAPSNTAPAFEGREIVLGPRAGRYYIVRSGLTEGERVVTRGAFKIDSALQILARPSMMSPDGAPGAGAHAGHAKGKKKGEKDKPTEKLPPLFTHHLHGVLAAGADVDRAVAAGDLGRIRAAFAAVEGAVRAADAKLLTGPFRLTWRELAMRLANDGVEGKAVKTHQDAQRVAESLKGNLASLTARFRLHHDPAGPPAPTSRRRAPEGATHGH